MAIPWTIGINIATRHYHLQIIRQQLTRTLASHFNDVRDEIINSFDDLVPACDDSNVLSLSAITIYSFTSFLAEWVSVPMLNFARNVVCRTSNRVYIGLPLCKLLALTK